MLYLPEKMEETTGATMEVIMVPQTQMTTIQLLLLLKPLPLRPQPPPQQLLAAFLTIVQLAKTPRVRAAVMLVGSIFGAFAINTATTKTENEIFKKTAILTQ